MNKPITIARAELVKNLTELINSAGLPAFVVLDVLNSMIPEVGRAAQAQYEADLKTWNEGGQEDG